MTVQDYKTALGDRLRGIRQQQGLTLNDVEERSDGQWKAVVVGSYERGDRAISIARLEQLAGFYGVPLSELLPTPTTEPAPEPPTLEPAGGVPLNLADLEAVPDDGPEPFVALRRFAHSIQLRRGDFNGQVLTIRDGDLAALAQALGTQPDELRDDLDEHGLLRAG